MIRTVVIEAHIGKELLQLREVIQGDTTLHYLIWREDGKYYNFVKYDFYHTWELPKGFERDIKTHYSNAASTFNRLTKKEKEVIELVPVGNGNYSGIVKNRYTINERWYDFIDGKFLPIMSCTERIAHVNDAKRIINILREEEKQVTTLPGFSGKVEIKKKIDVSATIVNVITLVINLVWTIVKGVTKSIPFIMWLIPLVLFIYYVNWINNKADAIGVTLYFSMIFGIIFFVTDLVCYLGESLPHKRRHLITHALYWISNLFRSTLDKCIVIKETEIYTTQEECNPQVDIPLLVEEEPVNIFEQMRVEVPIELPAYHWMENEDIRGRLN